MSLTHSPQPEKASRGLGTAFGAASSDRSALEDSTSGGHHGTDSSVPPCQPIPPRGDAGSSSSCRSALACDTTEVETVAHCQLPTFWKASPDLWFIQIEAAFQTNRIQSDAARYNLVLTNLDSETVQEVADILRSPPATGRYNCLKEAILDRLTDSADRQLYKLLTQLELGDKKPSQLLRQMKSLAGDSVSDDVIRVKWLDLLPPPVGRLLKVFKAPNLNELATAADGLIDIGPTVAATSHIQVSTPSSGYASPVGQSEMAQELAALRVSMAQLIALTREILERKVLPQGSVRRSRSRSRSADRRTGRATTPVPGVSNTWCWYHRTFGKESRNCHQPCAFSQSQGNA